MSSIGHNPPPVTVVVPVLNRAGTIGPCLESLLASRYPPERLEILVVDNGSTDASVELIRRFADRYPARLRALEEPGRGPSMARNAGIAAAGGEVLAFTDSDCVVDPGWLPALIAPLADPSVGATGGRILSFPGDGVIAQFGERIHDHQKAMEVLWPGYMISMNFATRRDVLGAVGVFDTAMLRCEDVDLSLRIRAAGYGWRYVHEAVIRHRNRRTLGELAREGFLHGRFLARHGPRLAAAADRIGPRPPGAVPRRRGEYTHRLPRSTSAILEAWFRAFKLLGRLLGGGSG